MPAILRKLPFYDRPTTVELQGREYRILANQIIVWVSVGPKGQRDPDPGTPHFPAVLDTGFTDTFLIQERRLREFAGLQPLHLPRLDSAFHIPGRQIPIHAANLWLHANRPGERDELAERRPFLMELSRGIGICTDPDSYPRLPLLGARALRRSELRIWIDYWKCRVGVRGRPRFWIFG